MLLLWLSILVLVPFDLHTVDSTLTAVTTTDDDATAAAAAKAQSNAAASAAGKTGTAASSLIQSIITTATSYLGDPGAVRDAAAVCLSRLLTRYRTKRGALLLLWQVH